MFGLNHLFGARFMYEPDGGGSGDGNKTFTQDDLNRILAEHKRSMQKELQDLKSRLDAESKSRGDMEDMLIEAAGGEEAVERFMETGEMGNDDYDESVNIDGDDEGGIPIEGAESVQALVNGITKRHRAEMEAIRKRLDKEIETRENLETVRLEQDRDAMLADALVKNNVVDVGAGVKLFRDSMEYDEDLAKWRYKSKDGLYLDPDAGIAESLPDWMRKPMGGAGGSGSRGSSPGVAASMLTRKQAELAELEKKAKSSGNQNDIMSYQKASREVKELTQAANPQK